MTIAIRKPEAAELQAYIDGEVAAYKLTVHGTNPHTNDRSKTGAIVPVFLETLGNQDRPLIEYAKLIEAGFKPSGVQGLEARLVADQYALQSMTVYLNKPEHMQAEDIAAITEQVTAQYASEIETHNAYVFAQEAQALRNEEARVAAELKAEEAAQQEAEFQRRVRDRIAAATRPAPKKATGAIPAKNTTAEVAG